MGRASDDDEPTTGRNPYVTSEAQARLREQDEADARTETAEQPVPGSEPADEDAGRRRRRRSKDVDGKEVDGSDVDGSDDGGERSSRRLSLPLVPFLAALLVLLLAGTAFLWFTRPERSSVGTTDYVQALEAARSEVVDLTSFDYVTLDEDIARIKRVSIGDLQKESVGQLDTQRQQLTQAQAVVNTEVVGAGVTRASSSDATVLLVIQSTQKSAASPQAQVVRYRIEAQLKKVKGKWLLSGITGR
jgi:Mce-associated membrane protein